MSNLTLDQEIAGGAFRVPAWHNLGYVDPDGKPLTVDEAIDKGDFPSGMELEPIRTESGMDLPDKRAVIATWDDGRRVATGVVGDKYVPKTPREGFSLLEGVVESNEIEVEAAVGLRGWRKVVLTCRLPEHFTIDPEGIDDTARLYAFTSMGNDGNAGITTALTPIVPVCINTEEAALSWARNSKRHFTVHHRANIDSRMELIRKALQFGRDHVAEFCRAATLLARTPIDEKQWDEFLSTFLVPEPKDGAPGYVRSRADGKREMLDLIYKGKAVDLGDGRMQQSANGRATGTLYGVTSAWSEYLDHFRPTKDGDRYRRDVAVIEGEYAADKTDLFNRVVKMAVAKNLGYGDSPDKARAVDKDDVRRVLATV